MKRSDLTGGLAAAIDALFTLLPGLRQTFEAFTVPRDAPDQNPPMEACRAMLAQAEATLSLIRDARPEDEMLARPITLEEAMRESSAWSNTINFNPTRYACRPFSNAIAFAKTVIDVWVAYANIRENCWYAQEHLDRAWDSIGSLMWDRTDVLIVMGNMRHSEGIRKRAQDALAAAGVTGGWWLFTLDAMDKWKFQRCAVHGMGYEDENELPVPDGLYADVVHDERFFDRVLLPEEVGHDTLPEID